MSRTDKHRPDWVQMADPANRAYVYEHHLHLPGTVCDLSPLTPATRIWPWKRFPYRCSWGTHFYGFCGGMYPVPRSEKVERRIREGGARVRWVQLRKRLMVEDLWDVQDDLTVRHRHSLAWDRW